MNLHKKSSDQLSQVFLALAHPTRREILSSLIKSEGRSVNEVAKPFENEMSLVAIHKHLKVLEKAGLISKSKEKQQRLSYLEAEPLKKAADYLEQYEQFWSEGFDKMDIYLQELKKKENKMSDQKSKNNQGLTVKRTFNSSVESVYKMWTNSNLFDKWYGPKGITSESKLDPRPEGKLTIKMKMPNGNVFPTSGVYQEIVKNQKIVYSESAGPNEMRNTITFKDNNGKTEMTLHSEVIKGPPGTEDHFENIGNAWNQSFDKLGEAL